jgi:hypothetical protein
MAAAATSEDNKAKEASSSSSPTSATAKGESESVALPPSRIAQVFNYVPVAELSSLINKILITNVVPDRLVRQAMRYVNISYPRPSIHPSCCCCYCYCYCSVDIHALS